MTTDALRTLTIKALLPGAKLWPNGLGFDCRGWEYSYSEQSEDWCALKRRREPRRFGRGASPLEAKQAAKVVL